jgi:D-cysteine desulfhydrase
LWGWGKRFIPNWLTRFAQSFAEVCSEGRFKMVERSNISVEWNEDHRLDLGHLVPLLLIFAEFLPNPLRTQMNIEEYAEKVHALAEIGLLKEDNEIVGLVIVYANDLVRRTGHLTLISIKPTHQRRGLGGQLLRRTLARARLKGMHHLTLWTGFADPPRGAWRLYQRLGFHIVSTASDRVFMSLDLYGGWGVTRLAPSPVHSIRHFASALGLDIDLRMKRDDLYSLAGGGVKARRAQAIIRECLGRGYDAVVTTGSIFSNHARSMAILAAAHGIRCHVVVTASCDSHVPENLNVRMIRLSGASLEFCEKADLAQRMDSAVRRLDDQGHSTLYVWGGGSGVRGTGVMVECAVEARTQLEGWEPDFVVCASATGSTHAGIGIEFANTTARVIGISVARDRARGTADVWKCIDEWFEGGRDKTRPRSVEFRDDWIAGRYGESNEEIRSITAFGARHGIFLDPVYAGKAFCGLISMIEKGEVPRGSRVLFWNTGSFIGVADGTI